MMGSLDKKYGAASQAIAPTGQGTRKSAHIPAAATAALSYQRDKEKERADTAEAKIAELEVEGAKKGVRSLPIDAIDDSPYQPRITYHQDALQELAATIEKAGQQEPIKVREKEDGRFELISGHRRLRAVRDVLAWGEINAYVVSASDTEAQRATMLANEARENLTDYERAKLYAKAQELGIAKTQQELAEYFGTSQARVSRTLAMLALPAEYIEQLEQNAGAITAIQAVDIREQLKAPAPAPEPETKPEAAPKKATPRRPGNVVTDNAGKPIFTARSSGREISVRINDAGYDPEAVKMAILEALREFGKK